MDVNASFVEKLEMSITIGKMIVIDVQFAGKLVIIIMTGLKIAKNVPSAVNREKLIIAGKVANAKNAKKRGMNNTTGAKIAKNVPDAGRLKKINITGMDVNVPYVVRHVMSNMIGVVANVQDVVRYVMSNI